MYREGGLVWGMVSLALVLLTINWVRKLEQRRDDV
jgi:heme exporter protein D